MGFVPDFKYGQIPTERNGRVEFRSCYLKEGCDYGILAQHLTTVVNGATYSRTEWDVLHLPTRIVVATGFTKSDDAEDEIGRILQRKSEETVFDIDVLEGRILAMRDLPDRWANCVAALERAYTNS